MKSKLFRFSLEWLSVAVILTFIFAAIYGAVQQDLRQTANDPQIQIAEDAAAALTAGQTPQSVLPLKKVDLAKSLAPYIILYHENGVPFAASGLISGYFPTLPSGVFAYVKGHGEDRFTWQPRSGVRSAAVVVHYTGVQSGFVLAGRSIREIEWRETQIRNLVAALWAGSLLVTCIIFWKRFKDKLS